MADYSNVSRLALAEYNSMIGDLNSKGEHLSERDQAALFALCVEKQTLKAPASAVFPPLNQFIVNGSNDNYSVSGYVDSQNSYGAMIRSKFTYNIEKTSEGWRCTNNFVDTSQQISAQINRQANSSTVGLFIVLSIIGLIFFVIEMAIAGGF